MIVRMKKVSVVCLAAEAEAALKKSKCFYQDVIAGNQCVLSIKYLSPCNAGFFMVGVSPIEQSKKS